MNYHSRNALVALAMLALSVGCLQGQANHGWVRKTFHAAMIADIYVSPTGNDAADGSFGAPLASLDGARLRARALRDSGHVGTIVIEFMAGTYRFARPVQFEAADSGRADACVIYRAMHGAEVILSGGVPVRDFQPLTDAALLARLPEEARGKVLVADLRAQGIADYGKLGVRGQTKGKPLAEAELFYDAKPMTLARWPKEGFRKALAKDDGNNRVVLDAEGRVARWRDEKEPWILAYWHHDWADLFEPIVGFGDKADEILRDPAQKPHYGLTPARTRWYAFNLFSELSAPGDYYLDREEGKLYFVPPHEGGDAVLSLSEGIIRGKDLSYVLFDGFTMEATRGTLLSISGGQYCQVVGCFLRNAGHSAVAMSGSHHTVYGCDVYETGEGGISASGGDRKTLTDGHNNIENNHVHHYSRRTRCYRTGVSVSGCGNRLAHNLVHHGPHMAISASGNNHIVEYNEIHNTVQESGDAGAYYVGRDWTQRGNILRYNYWHNIKGSSTYGGMTIYLDDQHSGHTIFGNIFENCNQAVFIGGGDDNVVDNNIFVNCWKAAHLDNRGMGWQKAATDNEQGELRTRLRAMPYQSELWAKAYPQLVNILADDPGVPKRNVFTRNVSSGGLWYDVHRGTLEFQTVERNVVYDDDPSWITLKKDSLGRISGITFKDEAELKAINFEPIPYEKMGLQRDVRRANWPMQRRIDLVKIGSGEAKKSAGPAKKMANLSKLPTLVVPRGATPASELMVLSVNFDGVVAEPAASARFAHDGAVLRVLVESPLPAKRDLGEKWGPSDAVELSLMASDGANDDVHVFRGYGTGAFEHFVIRAGQKVAGEAAGAATHRAGVTASSWRSEWSLPLSLLGVAAGDRLRANVTVRRSGSGEFIMWRPTHGDSTHCERVGFLELTP